MESESQVQMLQEMGFSKKQALEALSASGHDLNKAIAYLFGEVDPTPGNGTQQSPFDLEQDSAGTAGSVHISNPQEIPEFLSSYPSNASTDEPRHFEHPVAAIPSNDSLVSSDAIVAKTTKEKQGPYTGSASSSSSSSSSLNEDMAECLSEEEEYPENTKTELTNVPFLLCKDRQFKAWIPMLMILANSSIFAIPVLQSNSESRFVQELQRVVYFVQNFANSSRWYHDTQELTKVLENDGPRGSLHDEEMILNMIDFLMRKEPSLKPVFESVVHSVDEEISNNLTVLEIDSEARCPTLYETLNELFWQKNFENLGRIKYTSVAPIVTYQLLADSDMTNSYFQLPESIYPELYSDKAIDRVQQEVHSIKRAQMEYQKSNRKLMDLNFFEGKKIDGLLSQSAAAIQESNPGASSDLHELAESLQKCRLGELENQSRAKSDASSSRLKSYEHIIADLPQLRPYRLVGVILSETRYFLRAADSWIDFESGVSVGFENVRATVERHIDSTIITLVYGDARENEPISLEVAAAAEPPQQISEDCGQKNQPTMDSQGSDPQSLASDPLSTRSSPQSNASNNLWADAQVEAPAIGKISPEIEPAEPRAKKTSGPRQENPGSDSASSPSAWAHAAPETAHNKSDIHAGETTTEVATINAPDKKIGTATKTEMDMDAKPGSGAGASLNTDIDTKSDAGLDTHKNHGDFVKRPRRAQASEGAPFQEQTGINGTQILRRICVNPHVVQRFLQDEEKISPNAVREARTSCESMAPLQEEA